jgi:hypothetical protein
MFSGMIVLGLLTGCMAYHFSRSANTSYSLNWDYDVSTKEMLIDLEKEKENSAKQKMHLGVTWLFEPSINFYRETKKLDWLQKVTRENVSAEYDFYYVSDEDQKNIPEGKITIKEYPASKSRLMK